MGGIEDRLSNIRTNIRKVKKRADLPLSANNETVQIVCYGPSLKYTWQEIDLNKSVVTVSAAHDFLRERRITPNAHVEFDWRPHKAKHVNNPGDTVFYLASCVHPDLIAKVDPILWHAQQTAKENKYIFRREPGSFLVPGGSSAGLRAIELMYALGFRKFDIFGMDSSFEESEWAGPHHGKSRDKREIIVFPLAGRKFKTSIAFLVYADQFKSCKAVLKDASFTLHGDGLIQAMNTKERAV